MDTLSMLQAKLNRRGVDLQAIADRAQVSVKTIRRLKKGGHSPNWSTAESVKAALAEMYPAARAKGNTRARSVPEPAAA